jgi:hypothetical protein
MVTAGVLAVAVVLPTVNTTVSPASMPVEYPVIEPAVAELKATVQLPVDVAPVGSVAVQPHDVPEVGNSVPVIANAGSVPNGTTVGVIAVTVG